MGEELDAQVARLLGWRQVAVGEPRGLESTYRKPGYWMPPGERSPKARRGPPPFSTDVGWAWKVVEWMRELGWCFGLKDDASCDWLAKFDNLSGQVWYGRAETAPLAICLAALEVPRAPGGPT